jgi:hypothetical protein
LIVLLQIFCISYLCASVGRAGLKQIQATNCDFDDNMMRTTAQIMVWDSVKQKEIGVTTAEWATIRGKLGKEGEWKNASLRPDGLRFFGDTSPDGKDLFRKQIEQSLAKGEKFWKGPSWNAFVEAVSRPETRAHTTIITARLHSPESIHAGLEFLKKQGLIVDVIPVENIYPVAWPDFPKELSGKDYSESKAKVMTGLLDQIEKQPVPADALLVENQNGTGKAKLHLWGFSDDDYGNYRKAVSVLSEQVKKGRWPHVKVVIFLTGSDGPEKAGAVVIKLDGTTRPVNRMEATQMGYAR